MEHHIDLYSVMISAILYTIIFVVWFSKWLFGPLWTKTETGKKWWASSPFQKSLDNFQRESAANRLSGEGVVLPHTTPSPDNRFPAALTRKLSQGFLKRTTRLSWNFLLGIGLSYFLAFFDASLQVTSVGDAMFSSLCLWLGFVLPTQLFPVIWHGKPVRLFLIEAGFMLLSLLVMGGIIGA